MSARSCGSCQECCSRLPVRELGKGANERCKHQKFGVGCAVYGKAAMPPSCRLWSCRWLVQPEETAGLSRPDRGNYIVDLMPDFITHIDNETGVKTNVEAVQVWVNPRTRNAYKNKALREYLSAQAEKGVAAIIRYGATDSFVLIAPILHGGEGWLEIRNGLQMRDHTPEELVAALGGNLKITIEEKRA